MSVDVPDSGDVITTANIESMHTDVRDAINSLGTEQMGGSTLGPSQLPSLIHTADYLEVKTNDEVVFDAKLNFDESDITTSGGWRRLDNYVLDNGGSGYEIPYDGFIYAYCSLRISAWDSYDGTGSTNGNQQVWANLWYEFDTVNYKFVRNSRFIHVKEFLRKDGNAQSSDKRAIEETISIAWLEKVTPGTLNMITITSAGNHATVSSSSSTLNADIAVVNNGTIGFFYIPREV